MKHEAVGLSDVGRVRKNNEDSIKSDPQIGYYVVCDGMGGHAAGEVASGTVTTVAHAVVRKHYKVLRKYAEIPNQTNRDEATRLCEYAIQAACKEVFSLSKSDPSKAGMGTTCVALAICGGNAIVAHVGDSRCYMIRQMQVHQMTEDHSLVSEQLKKGLITPEEAAKSAFGSVLTRAVGFHESVEVDTLSFELMAGDCFVLCTDGLTDYLSGREIGKMVEKHPINDLPGALIAMANKRGGKDNISCICVELAGRPDPNSLNVSRKIEALKQIPLFHTLDYTELMKVLNILTIENYKTGDRIITEGEESDKLLISLAGTVEVQKNGHRLAELPPGSFFGEMGLIAKSPRTADILALQPAKLMALHRKDFFSLLQREYQLSSKVMWAFCSVLNERLKATSEELSEVKGMLAVNHANVTDAAYVFGTDNQS